MPVSPSKTPLADSALRDRTPDSSPQRDVSPIRRAQTPSFGQSTNRPSRTPLADSAGAAQQTRETHSLLPSLSNLTIAGPSRTPLADSANAPHSSGEASTSTNTQNASDRNHSLRQGVKGLPQSGGLSAFEISELSIKVKEFSDERLDDFKNDPKALKQEILPEGKDMASNFIIAVLIQGSTNNTVEEKAKISKAIKILKKADD